MRGFAKLEGREMRLWTAYLRLFVRKHRLAIDFVGNSFVTKNGDLYPDPLITIKSLR